MLFFYLTSWNLKEAAKIESLTAKGLKLEYIIIGEKINTRINKNPGGPIKYLYQGPFPSYLILSI